MFDFDVLAQDPSRMVREGLRSFLKHLKTIICPRLRQQPGPGPGRLGFGLGDRPGRAGSERAEPSRLRAGPSRAEPSRATTRSPSRAEPSRAEPRSSGGLQEVFGRSSGAFLVKFGCTELIRGASKAKKTSELFDAVRF